MTSSEIWDAETARRYDVDSAEKFAPEVLDPAVDLLAEVAGTGPLLEFAVGTGRVAIPLVQRGLPVAGIELSAAMVDMLRRKIDEQALPVVVGDMATTVVPGRYSLVYLVWNSISNLRTQAEQVACFANAARHLQPGGRFVLELWVPPIHRLSTASDIVPMSLTEGHLVFDRYDLVGQRCSSHHYYTDPDGTVRYGTGSFRYLWPSECDLMAQLAGLQLEARYADWDKSPFTAASESHVSVWRKPTDDLLNHAPPNVVPTRE